MSCKLTVYRDSFTSCLTDPRNALSYAHSVVHKGGR